MFCYVSLQQGDQHAANSFRLGEDTSHRGEDCVHIDKTDDVRQVVLLSRYFDEIKLVITC